MPAIRPASRYRPTRFGSPVRSGVCWGITGFGLGNQVDTCGGFVPYALCAARCAKSTKLLRSKQRHKCDQPVSSAGGMPDYAPDTGVNYCDTRELGRPGRCSPGRDVAEFPARSGHNRAVLCVPTRATRLAKMEGLGPTSLTIPPAR